MDLDPVTLSPKLRRTVRVLFVLALLAVTWLALSSAPPPQADTGWDKGNHLLAFGALALLACGSTGVRRSRRLWSAAGLLGYGVLIELAQSLTPNRSAELADLLADLAGIALGQAVAVVLFRWSGRRPPASPGR